MQQTNWNGVCKPAIGDPLGGRIIQVTKLEQDKIAPRGPNIASSGVKIPMLVIAFIAIHTSFWLWKSGKTERYRIIPAVMAVAVIAIVSVWFSRDQEIAMRNCPC